MRRKKLLIFCVSFVMLGGLYVSFQREMKAASVNFNQPGVSITCPENDSMGCAVTIELRELYTFADQLASIPSQLGSRNIDVLKLKTDDSISDAQWFPLQDTIPFGKVSTLDLSEAKFATGVMPDNAFKQSLDHVRGGNLFLPKDTKIAQKSLLGLSNVSSIHIPKGNTIIENGAFDGVFKSISMSGSGGSLYIHNDFSKYYQAIEGGTSVTQFHFDLDALSGNDTASLQYYNGNRVYVNSVGDSKNIVADFDVLYGSGSGKAKIERIYTQTAIKGIRISNAPKISSLALTGGTTYVVKDCALYEVPTRSVTDPDFTELDISGNNIDFTSTTNKAFYEKYNALSFPLDRQKPKLMLGTIDDIELNVDDELPTITPTYKYADGTAIDFTQAPPTWMDTDYFNAYASNVTFSDSPSTISTNSPGTFTRTYKNKKGDTIGTAKVVISANAKETPTIVLAKAGATSPTSVDELTFTATLTKTGEHDINNDAKVKFMDGETLLGEVVIADGKAEYKTKLSAGQHNITAKYSGNTNFNTVTSTPAISITVAAPSGGSGLTAQTLSFENDTVNMTFGDSVASNPLTQSDPHGTGTITYESSDTSVATVDSTGVVTVLKAGTTTITATIAADTTYDSATASYNLTITTPSGGSELTAQTLSFENDTVNMTFGDTVASNPLTQSDPHGTGTITYESSDITVATVDSTGTVTVLKAGTTTITATVAADTIYDSATASYSLTVNALGGLATQTIEFKDKAVSIIYGDTVVNPLTQSDPHGTGAITYKSSDESVATVDSTGAVTILKVGTTTITAQIATDAIYASATDSYELTIAKKQASITGLLAKDKVYDGKMSVTFDTENAKVGGILPSDAENLKFMLGSGAYQDSKAGVDKAITLNDFILQGANAGNYELVLPSLTGTITKAELVVNVQDKTKKEGNENPAFTYVITGFVNNETESSLSGYTKPIMESSANKTSPAGSYAITGKNASSDNYTFTYKNGTLTIKAEVVADDKSYVIEGVIGKNGWYTSKVKIKPTGNFTKIYNGKTWVSELIYEDGAHKNLKFKFKQADETESNEVIIAELKVDSTPPSVKNIKNGDTYFINRAFQAQDNQAVKVRINGKEVSEAELQVIADTSNSYAIELEDEAGNITSLTVDTKSLEETIKPIEGITSENVEAKDKATIEDMLLKVTDLLNDTAYSPTSDQKKQLEETKVKCETLLKQLNTADAGKEEDAVKPATSNGVNTGDPSDIVYYGGFCLLAISVIVSIKRRTQMND